MNAMKTDPDIPDRPYAQPSEADRVRELLRLANIGQRAAAIELDINERTMRKYCAGEKVPRVVFLALERLVDLQRQVGNSAGSGGTGDGS